MTTALTVEQAYGIVHGAQARSPTLRRLWRHAAGNDYPEAFDHLSFVTLTELHRIADCLRLVSGSTLVDLACGTGAPGLWIARETGVRLVGIDVSAVALARAAERAAGLGLSGRALYRHGTFAETGLPDATAAGVLSVDALLYAPDKARALREVVRVLRPGGRFVFTSFEIDRAAAAGLPGHGEDPTDDYRPSVESAGLALEVYEETQGWRERLEATWGALLSHRAALVEEMGETAVRAILRELSQAVERGLYRRRVLAVAAPVRSGVA